MITLNKQQIIFGIGCLVIFVCTVFFLRSVSFGILDTDSAKYALNIAVPHPPLGRWFMVASQWIFGYNVFAARFPSFLAGMLSFWLFLKLVFKREKSILLLVFLLIALNAGVIFLMGRGYQTSFLSCAIAFIVYGTTKETRARFVWITLGYLLAIWTQLQGLLLFPVVCILFWQAWCENKFEFRINNWAFLSLSFVVAHTGLVVLWLLTNPLSIADALSLAHRGSSNGIERILAFFQATPGWLLVFAFFLAAFSFFARRGQRIKVASVFVGISVFSLYFFKNPASYYMPYAFAFVSWSLIIVDISKKWMNFLVLFFVAIICFVDGRIVWPALIQEAPYVHTKEIIALQSIAKIHSTDTMALGKFGYEWNYFLQKRFVRFTTDLDIQSKIKTLFVFFPETLSWDETYFLSSFSRKTHIGTVDIYER
jgi:4-amino-4-deoxy-L-arabinose transferase-like glycosyltransferase